MLTTAQPQHYKVPPNTAPVDSSPHTLEELKTFKNAAFLNVADYVALKNIVKNFQLVFSPCNCSGPFLPGRVMFTQESNKNLTGIGSVPTRFKCNASSCNNSFSAIDLLIKFSSWCPDPKEHAHEETNVASGPKRQKTGKDLSESDDLFTQPPQSSTPEAITFQPFPSNFPPELIDALHKIAESNTVLAKQVGSISNVTETLLSRLEKQQSVISSLEQRLSRLESTPSSIQITPVTTPHSSPAPSINASVTNPPAPTTAAHISYARAVTSIQSLPRSQGIEALRKLHRYNDRSSQPAPSSATAAVYVSGFQWQKIMTIRSALFEARFQMRRIHKISWIGKTIIEVVLSDDYKTQFSSEMTAAGYTIITLDPTHNPRAANQEAALHAKKCFVVRAVRTILNTRSEIVKRHFNDLVAKGDIELQNLFQAEMNIALATRKENVETIVHRLLNEDLSLPDRNELVAELKYLDPNNRLLHEASDEMAVTPEEGDGLN